MKKTLLGIGLCFLILTISGCVSKDSDVEKNVKEFLTAIYQVKNTDTYTEMMKKITEDSQAEKMGTGVIQKSDEPYKPFLARYENYCTEETLDLLIQNGYLYQYEQLAAEEECQFMVKDITLKLDDTQKQYHYTVQVEKRLKDNIIQILTSEGTVKINEEGYISWFKINKRLG